VGLDDTMAVAKLVGDDLIQEEALQTLLARDIVNGYDGLWRVDLRFQIYDLRTRDSVS